MGSESIVYLSVADVISLYDLAMRESGQPPAALVREDALHSAVHHPRNLGYYEGASLAEQAVELMVRIAAAHAWVDGNKRIATLSLYMFLGQNGVTVPNEDEYMHVADALIAYVAASDEERDAVQRALIDRIRNWP